MYREVEIIRSVKDTELSQSFRLHLESERRFRLYQLGMGERLQELYREYTGQSLFLYSSLFAKTDR